MKRKKLEEIFLALYANRILQTVWTARNEANRKNGWALKDKTQAPWFLNLREIGNYPMIFQGVCQASADMLREISSSVDLAIGVDMAGVPLIGGAIIELLHAGEEMRFGYTRPLEKKVRTLSELLEQMAAWDATKYGQKSVVEAVMYPGNKIAIFDDMATGLASKKIARLMVLYEAENRGLADVTCNEIVYFMDRGQNNIEAGLNYKNETDARLKPAALNVHYAINFGTYLPLLEDEMTENEYATIVEHQRNKNRFGTDIPWRQQVLAAAKAEAH